MKGRSDGSLGLPCHEVCWDGRMKGGEEKDRDVIGGDGEEWKRGEDWKECAQTEREHPEGEGRAG